MYIVATWQRDHEQYAMPEAQIATEYDARFEEPLFNQLRRHQETLGARLDKIKAMFRFQASYGVRMVRWTKVSANGQVKMPRKGYRPRTEAEIAKSIDAMAILIREPGVPECFQIRSLLLAARVQDIASAVPAPSSPMPMPMPAVLGDLGSASASGASSLRSLKLSAGAAAFVPSRARKVATLDGLQQKRAAIETKTAKSAKHEREIDEDYVGSDATRKDVADEHQLGHRPSWTSTLDSATTQVHEEWVSGLDVEKITASDQSDKEQKSVIRPLSQVSASDSEEWRDNILSISSVDDLQERKQASVERLKVWMFCRRIVTETTEQSVIICKVAYVRRVRNLRYEAVVKIEVCSTTAHC